MSEARLIINSEKEFELNGDFVSIGRASDNDVSFFEDSNVSRYHAEIERRGDSEFWIFDLNSSNGTTVNGEKVTTEKPLFDGDEIILGGTSRIQVQLSPVEKEEEETETEETVEETTAEEDIEEEVPAEKKPKVSLLFIFAGLFVGLAFISVMAAAIFFFTRGGGGLGGSGCQAQAKILNPRNGEFLKQAAEIEIDLQNGECVQKVIFLMDGKAFAASDTAPFSATLDPAQFPDLAADGLDHNLSLVLVDENGQEIPQPVEIALALETVKTKKPDDDENGIEINQPDGNPPPIVQQESTMSLIDVQKMTRNVVPQFAGKFEYETNNQSFLQAVRKTTSEYAAEGYFERAKKYSDVIAKEFIENRDLDPPLGFVLAMSRTKFEPTNKSDGAGLWNMDNGLVLENAYNGSCGAETIAAPSQKCAAIASSLYLKDIVRDVFEGDIIYGIAAFGMSKSEAAAWKATLPPPNERKDFWNVIKSQEQKENVIRFFAAATVAENPQKYGLKNDKPLSELYKIYMK